MPSVRNNDSGLPPESSLYGGPEIGRTQPVAQTQALGELARRHTAPVTEQIVQLPAPVELQTISVA